MSRALISSIHKQVQMALSRALPAMQAVPQFDRLFPALVATLFAMPLANPTLKRIGTHPCGPHGPCGHHLDLHLSHRILVSPLSRLSSAAFHAALSSPGPSS